MRNSVQVSAYTGFRSRLLVGAAMSLPLVALSSQAHADPILQSSNGDITVEAASASGTPVAVELLSTDGSINVSVTTVTGTAQQGERDYIVGLETLTSGSITGTFGSITGTGQGQLLALGASTNSGDIAISVGQIAMDGEATAGLHAHSVSGDITLQADSVVLNGTGIDPLYEVYPEAIFGYSQQGAVSITAGHAETHGQWGSAAVAIAGTDAVVDVDTAIAHGDQAVAIHARGGTSATVRAGTVTETGLGAGIEAYSPGNVVIEAENVTAGTHGVYARAGGNIDITVGTVASGSSAINAASDAGGSITVDAGTVSSTDENWAAIGTQTNGDGAITISVEEANGAGVDRGTVVARSENGDITISGGSVTASGDAGLGVYATSINGDVAVTLDSVATTGLGMVNGHVSEGVLAESINGTASVVVGTASAEGIYASAAVALGGAGAGITSTEASSAGDGAAVLYAWSANGSATVDSGTVTLRGNQQGAINAIADGGVATVTSDAVYGQGTMGNGIFAVGTQGAAITSGTVSVQNTGLRAIGLNGSSSTIVTTGDTISEFGQAIFGSGGQVSITTGADTLTSGATYGIRAMSSGTVDIVNGGTAQATGDLGNAIHVTAPGAVTISSKAVVVTGPGAEPALRPDGYRVDQGGIVVDGGEGAIAIEADTVDVEGAYRYGITARGNGAIAITANTVNLASADSVAVVARGGAGDVSITTGSVTTTGASGVGVFANTTSGNITIDAGTTRVENAGMQGNFTGDAVVGISETGQVSIASDDAFSAAFGGSAVVGIGGSVTIDSGRAETTGDGGIAIYAHASSGDATVTAAETVLSGDDTYGIYSRAMQGDSTINVGTLTSTGELGAGGAYARADAGTATIVTTGDVQSAGGFGLRGYGAAVIIETGEDTLTSGGTMGILANATGTTSVVNNGTASGVTHGINATAAGDVSVQSVTAIATGQNGVGILANSSQGGEITINSQSASSTAAGGRGIQAISGQGSVNIVAGDVIASGSGETLSQAGIGILAISQNTNVTVNGSVQSVGVGVAAQAAFGHTRVVINGSVESENSAGVLSTAVLGNVDIAEGASVLGTTGVVFRGGPQESSFVELHNSGTITGHNIGVLVTPGFAQGENPPPPAPQVYIRNDGTIISQGELAIQTSAGDDYLELTERSQITGIADLGDGFDHLILDFNEDASADAVGQVVSTRNVEVLSVETGSWLANGLQSQYNFVEIEHGATLTVAENTDGDMAITTPHVELEGTLRLDLASDTEAGDLAGLLIEGAGSLHLVGEAAVLVDDASGLQYTGGTFVENGALVLTDTWGGTITTSGDGAFQLGNGGTTGDFTGDIVNNGAFVFARSDDYSLTGSFVGTGLTVKDGAGTLTFAGFYGFEGVTQILNGGIAFTGNLSDDTQLNLSGEGTVDLSQVQSGQQTIAELSGTGGTLILGSTNLTIDQSGDTVFAGTISGTGTLTKDGEGDLKLNGDSDFSGTGQVDGGTLSVNGSFANANFIVNPGGTLGGSGTVGDTAIQSGTLAAGNSIGTLVVAGDLSFTSGSVLEVEVDPAGNADLIQVTGTATLGNAAVNVLAGAGTYAAYTDYTILTAAGGISGTFGSATTNLAFLVPLLSYTVDTVTLRLARNDIDFSAFGATPNQQAVGNLIESLGFGNPLYYQALTLAQADVARGFETLTGEVYPAFGAQLIETIEMVGRQVSHEPGGQAGAFAWGTGLAGTLSGDGGSDFADIDVDNKGLVGGIGYSIGGATVSAGVGKVWQNADHDQIEDADLTFGTAQFAWSGAMGLHAKAGAMIGSVDGSVSRATALNTIAATVSGEIDGKFTQLSAEVGYSAPLGVVSVQPFAGISHVDIDLDGVTETGGDTALRIGEIDRKVTFGDIGIRLASAQSLSFAPYASAAYRRAWGDRASAADIGFAGNTSGLPITALPIARKAAELGAGLRYSSGLFGLDVGYTGTMSKTFDNHAFKVTAALRF